MSRASQRARARERWHQQAARLIGKAGAWRLTPGGVVSPGTSDRLAARGTLFDVAAVRAWCLDELERVLRAADRDALAVARDRIEADTGARWCLGAERPRYLAELRKVGPGLAPRGRWGRRLSSVLRLLDTLDGRCPWAPGAEAQPDACPECTGPASFCGVTVRLVDGSQVTATPGQRLVVLIREALVWGADGEPRQAQPGEFSLDACFACNASGHNLRGTLPDIEDDPGTIRAVADALRAVAVHVPLGVEDPTAAGVAMLARWQRRVYEQSRERVKDAMATRTRSHARGQHRSEVHEPPGAIVGIRATVASHGYEVGDLIRVRGYGHGRWAPRSTMTSRLSLPNPASLMPRWRRGELWHADSFGRNIRRGTRAIGMALRPALDDLVSDLANALAGSPPVGGA